MGIPKVSWVTFFLLALVVAAVPVSCYASRDAPDAGEKAAAAAIVEPQADPECNVMERCNVQACTEYCVGLGLQDKGFCTFRDLQFYCCCPVPEDPPRN